MAWPLLSNGILIERALMSSILLKLACVLFTSVAGAESVVVSRNLWFGTIDGQWFPEVQFEISIDDHRQLWVRPLLDPKDQVVRIAFHKINRSVAQPIVIKDFEPEHVFALNNIVYLSGNEGQRMYVISPYMGSQPRLRHGLYAITPWASGVLGSYLMGAGGPLQTAAGAVGLFTAAEGYMRRLCESVEDCFAFVNGTESPMKDQFQRPVRLVAMEHDSYGKVIDAKLEASDGSISWISERNRIHLNACNHVLR